MREDYQRTCSDVKEVVDVAKDLVDNLGTIIVKVSYPLLGNLDGLIQERLEGRLGNRYRTNAAAFTSTFTNGLLYASLFAYFYSSAEDPITPIVTGAIGFIASAAEFIYCVDTIRHVDGKTDIKVSRSSVLGAIISLPIEAMLGLYDGITARKQKGNTS